MIELPVGQIVQGDCLEVMRGWPDGCVDWVIADPPYGIEAPAMDFPNGSKRCPPLGARGGDAGWDNTALDEARFAEIVRVGLQWALFGANYFNTFLPPSRQWIVWDKMNGDCLFSHVELICTSRSGPDQMIRSPQNANAKQHPTGKPEGVMRKLIDKLTKPGDLILDPFAGSGTTCVAAERLGRRWIGIELSEEYCQIARARTAQKGLFT